MGRARAELIGLGRASARPFSKEQDMHNFHAFPAWRYSAGGARVFETQAEIDTTEGDWFKHPDEVGQKPEASKPEHSKPKRGRPAKS